MGKKVGSTLIRFIVVIIAARFSVPASGSSGFHISGRKVLDSKDNEFIMRGINHAHTWYESQLSTAIPAIAKTGANCVRVVLSNGKHAENWGKNDANDVKNVIKICKDNKLIPILEVHDCTGYPEKQGAVQLSTAVDYWIELKNELIGQEEYVIINIANEPFGNNVQASTWINEHKTAIERLRENGFEHLLIVDAANWGQDWEKIMQANAQEVFDSDENKNILFSIHMYDVYKDAATVDSYLKSFVTKGLPLIVGEFAADHGSASKNVDEAAILEKTKEYGIGYIGWSWKGNSSDLTSLDIAREWNGSSLSTWGTTLVNGSNGIKETSVAASIFTPVGTVPADLSSAGAMNTRITGDQSGWNIAFTATAHGKIRLSLTDLLGRNAASRTVSPAGDGTQRVYLDNGNMTAGTYILHVSDKTGMHVEGIHFTR